MIQTESPLSTADYGTLTDHGLLMTYERMQQERDKWAERLGRLEIEMWKRMEDRGATGIPSDEFVCEQETKNTYIQELLFPLKEVFSTAELMKCLIPAHQEIVPEKWNTNKVIALAKRYGTDAQRIVEQARTPQRPKLKFERR